MKTMDALGQLTDFFSQVSMDAVAVLVAGAGIIATCIVQYKGVANQIRASNEDNRLQLEAQKNALDVQLREQQRLTTEQLKEQTAAANREFAFQLQESRRARILANRSEAMQRIQEMFTQIQEYKSPSGDGIEERRSLTLASTSLHFVVEALCGDLRAPDAVLQNMDDLTDALREVIRGLGETEKTNELLLELFGSIQGLSAEALSRLESIHERLELEVTWR